MTRGEYPRFRIAEQVLTRRVRESDVLFHPETERLLILNECGSRIWDLLSEGVELADVIQCLREEFQEAEAQVEDEVLEFLSELEREQVILR